MEKKDNRLISYVLFFYIISVIIRYVFADFVKPITIYPDELRYYMIAENLASGRGLEIYNGYAGFQKILYSIILAPVFLIKNRELQGHILALVNCVVMSSAIFPFYLLAKKIIKSDRTIAGLCFLFVLMPDLTYTMTYMSEVAFFPIAMWTILGFYYLLNLENDDHKQYMLSAALGIGIYLLYLCKEISVVFIISYSLIIVWDILCVLKNQSHDARHAVWTEVINLVIMLTAFVGMFIVFKLTLFKGMGNSYNQTSIGVLFEEGRIIYLLYGFVYYLLNILIASGFFPIVLPAVYYRYMEQNVKKLYMLLVNLAIMSATVISFTISVREDFGRVVPRTHLRYVTYLWLPFICLLVNIVEKNTNKKLKKNWYILLVTSLSVIVLYKGAFDASSVDQTMLNYLCELSQNQILRYSIVFASSILLGLYGFVKHRKQFTLIFLILFSIIQIYNNAISINSHTVTYQISDEEVQDIVAVEELVKQHSDTNFLVIGSKIDRVQGIADAFLNYSNVYTTNIDYLVAEQNERGIDISRQKLKRFIFGTDDYSVNYIDYILARTDLVAEFNDEQCEKVDWFENDIFELYILKNNTQIPHILTPTNLGSNTTYTMEVNSDVFSSKFVQEEDASFMSAGEGCMLYGPYMVLPAGKYTITYYYSYDGGASDENVIGYVDLSSSNVDLSCYKKDFIAGKNFVTIEEVVIPEDAQGFEMRMYSNVYGITVGSVDITKCE